jgi:hypothetical protein
VLFAYSQGLLNKAGLAALGWTPDSKPPQGGSFEFVDGGAILRKPAAAYDGAGGADPGIESVLTVTGGDVVYSAGPFTMYASEPLPAVSPAWSPAAAFGGYQR